MLRFFQKIAIFMQGRNGNDKFNNFLYIVFLVLWFINIFIWNRTATLVIDLFMLAVLGYAVFRALSRNINKRSLENRNFMKFFDSVKNWLTLTQKKFRDRKDFRYIKCPICKAQLRVRNQKGNHRVRCPRCGSEFDKKI